MIDTEINVKKRTLSFYQHKSIREESRRSLLKCVLSRAVIYKIIIELMALKAEPDLGVPAAASATCFLLPASCPEIWLIGITLTQDSSEELFPLAEFCHLMFFIACVSSLCFPVFTQSFHECRFPDKISVLCLCLPALSKSVASGVACNTI